ncbi:hypothetical protein JA1_003398 [Spathaspora sp. JA1]|nr:hypothetical protein JA1_003398 [Spathaspora sp. JA1]
MATVYKQKLRGTDKPPSIPALQRNSDFSHAVDTFRPVSMDLSDIPYIIRRFNRNEEQEQTKPTRKRVVSTPITLDPYKEPTILPTTYNVEPPVGRAKRRVVSVPASVFRIKELPDIPQYAINETGQLQEQEEEEDAVEQFQSKISQSFREAVQVEPLEEAHTRLRNVIDNDAYDSQYFIPQEFHPEYPHHKINQINYPVQSHARHSNLSYHSYNSSNYQHQFGHSDDSLDYLTCEFSNLEYGNSNEESLFSEPLNDQNSSLEESTHSDDIFSTKELPPVPEILPKVRKKRDNSIPSSSIRKSIFVEKHNIIEQVKQRPYSYCLDLKNDYDESRYPIIPSKPPNFMEEQTANPKVNPKPKTNMRSVSDLQQYIRTTKEKLSNTRIASFIHSETNKQESIVPKKEASPQVPPKDKKKLPEPPIPPPTPPK